MSSETQRILETSPFTKLLGLRLKSEGKGEVVTELSLRADLMQQDGIAHAGVLATLADHSAGAAAGTLLEKNQMVLTAEFKINLLRAAKGDFLECHSKVLKAGKSLVVAESEIIDPKTQQLLAKAIVTMSVIIKR